MLIEVRLDGQAKLISTLDATGKAMAREIRGVLRQSGRTIATRAQADAPVFRGVLQSRVAVQTSAKSLSVAVRFRAAHSWIIGRGGRKPGTMPPPAALAEWAKARGIDPKKAFILARAIARKGIIPNLFADRALIAEYPNFIARTRAVLERVFREAGGQG